MPDIQNRDPHRGPHGSSFGGLVLRCIVSDTAKRSKHVEKNFRSSPDPDIASRSKDLVVV